MSETLRYGRVVSHADGSRELIDLFAEESRYPLAAFESPRVLRGPLSGLRWVSIASIRSFPMQFSGKWKLL